MSNEEGAGTTERPINPNLARDHLANERTFLAWIRSCIAIIALGFVVARFGLLIREQGGNAPPRTPTELSTGFGVAMVVCGAVLIILALRRYRDAANAIDRNTYHSSFGLILLLAGGLVVVAVLLAVYLLLAG